MNTPELVTEMLRLSRLLDKGVLALVEAATEYAEAEDTYAAAKATAYLASTGTVAERKAHVDDLTGTERRRALLADAMRQANLEAIRSRRQQLSALQSVAAGHRTELELARYGPQEHP